MKRLVVVVAMLALVIGCLPVGARAADLNVAGKSALLKSGILN